MDIKHEMPKRPEQTHLNTVSLMRYCEQVYDLPLSRPTIYRAQRAGKLNPIRVGGRLLFSISEVKTWIEGPLKDSDSGATRNRLG